MDTTEFPTSPTTSVIPGATRYSQELVIVLSVLLAAFGILSIVLLIWTICSRRAPPPPDPEVNHVFVPSTDIEMESVTPIGVQTAANNVPAGSPEDAQHAADHAPAAESPENPGEPETPATLEQGHEDPCDEDTEAEETKDRVAPLHKVKPQYSCRFARRSMDVFGSRVESTIEAQRASQIGLLQAAQRSYIHMIARDPDLRTTRTVESLIHTQMVEVQVEDGRTVEVEVPDVGEVLAVNISQLDKAPTRVAHAQAVSPVDIRPKSFFHTAEGVGSTDIKPEADVSRGMFISRKCRPDQATVVELHGVTLEIPVGALGVTETITLGILWSEDHQPNLDAKHAMLSPIISCEPHGLKLKKPVTLTLPHCAHEVHKNWKVHIRRSETTATKKPAWTVMESANPVIMKSKIRLDIDHFTLRTVTGESTGGADPPSKWVELYAFAPPLKSTTFEVMIFCVNDYDSEETREGANDIKKMERKRKNRGAKEMDSTSLLVKPNQNNIELSMAVSKETSQWSVADMCKTKQELNFSAVWQARCPESKYVLTTAKHTSKVMCSIQGHQIGGDDKVEIYIAEETRADDWIDPRILDPIFPKELRVQIAKLLDPKRTGASNWEHLLDRMGKPMIDLTWLADMQTRSGKNSPTLYLLQEWVMMGKTLPQFADLMVDLGRLDVQVEIESHTSSQTSPKLLQQ